MHNGLTAIVIFPIMLTGILPKLRMRSKLPPSCKLRVNKFRLAYIRSVARQRRLPMLPPVVNINFHYLEQKRKPAICLHYAKFNQLPHPKSDTRYFQLNNQKLHSTIRRLPMCRKLDHSVPSLPYPPLPPTQSWKRAEQPGAVRTIKISFPLPSNKWMLLSKHIQLAIPKQWGHVVCGTQNSLRYSSCFLNQAEASSCPWIAN